MDSGEFIQSRQFKAPIYFGPTIDDKNVYISFSNGELKSLNKSTFSENWTNFGVGPSASSVVISENYAYYPTLGKYIYIINKHTGEKLQEIKLDGRARSIPIIINGKLIIACEDENVNIFTLSK